MMSLQLINQQELLKAKTKKMKLLKTKKNLMIQVRQIMISLTFQSVLNGR
jgi:hypothetical protein